MNRFKIILILLITIGTTPIHKPILAQSNITASRQNAITNAVRVCSPAVVGINVIENKIGIAQRSSGN
jgi:hypothetical protein